MSGSLASKIPNFTASSDQIYIKDPATQAPNSPDDPDMILIFGWGDGLPKHVAKYAEGFSKLYPAAKQIVILGPISKVFFAKLARRVEDMTPVVEALKDIVGPQVTKKSKIMVHLMSNTGGSNYASMLQAYRDKYDQPFPHDLVVYDSTPGSADWSWKRMGQWSRAMSMGIANYFPWPEFITRFFMGFATMIVYIAGHLSGEEPAGKFACRIMDDTSYVPNDTKKLYLYSKEDDLISYEDIESFEAHARSKGYETKAVTFVGSPHVGHMRKHPEQYWASILEGWKWALQK
jgi:hypothetical protein